MRGEELGARNPSWCLCRIEFEFVERMHDAGEANDIYLVAALHRLAACSSWRQHMDELSLLHGEA